MTFAEYARYRKVSAFLVTKAVQTGKIKCVGEGLDRRIESEQADIDWEKNTMSSQRRRKTVGEMQAEVDRARAESEEPEPAPSSQPSAPKSPSKKQASLPKTDTQIYNAARAERETYNANLAKLDYEAKSGKLVEAEHVARSAFKIARTVRDSMLSIPDRLAAELAAETNQFRVHARLTEEIKKALVALKDEI